MNNNIINYACGSFDSTLATTFAGAFTLTNGDFIVELFTLTAVDFTTTAFATFATLTALGLLSLATDNLSALI